MYWTSLRSTTIRATPLAIAVCICESADLQRCPQGEVSRMLDDSDPPGQILNARSEWHRQIVLGEG
jgi:hypothetical protein